MKKRIPAVLFLIFFVLMCFLPDVKHYRMKLIFLDFSALFFFVYFLVWVFVKKKVLWFKHPADLWFFLYLALVFLRFLFMENKSVARMELEKNLLSAGIYIGVPYLLFKEDSGKILKLLAGSSLVIAIYGIWQNWGGRIFIFEVPKISPPYATFGNQNFFGAWLVLTAPLLFLLGPVKFPAIFVYILCLWCIKSRGAWLAFSFGILAFLIHKNSPLKFSKKTKTFILICALSGALFAGWRYRNFWLRDTHRLLIWKSTLSMGLKNPFGVGPGAFTSRFPEYASEKLKKVYPPEKYIVNFAHNEYLEIFSELGFAGIFLFAGMVFVFLKNCKNPYVFSAASAILFHNLFSVNMRYGITFGMLFFLFACEKAFNSKKIYFEAGKFRVFFPVLAAASIIFFTPKILEPLLAVKETAREEDFYEDVGDEEIEQILKRDPKEYKDFYELGWLFAKKKNYSRAIEFFSKAASINPTAGIFTNIGNIFFETGNKPKAEEFYRKALEINPAHTDALFNLGYVLFYQGRLSESAECFNEVLKMDPENAKAKVMLDKMKE